MDNRLIFLYPVAGEQQCQRGDAEGKAPPRDGLRGPNPQGGSQANPGPMNREVTGSRASGEGAGPTLPRKASLEVSHRTVPQTDTGRREEDSKAHERTLAKELGKLAP
jgi:acetylornithine deacetylase/succinyl-diaminopimelate desuccinylase-like protein